MVAMRYQLGQEADDLDFSPGFEDQLPGVMPSGSDPSLVGGTTALPTWGPGMAAGSGAAVATVQGGAVASSVVGPEVNGNGNGNGISTVMAVGVGLAVTALLFAWWRYK